MLMSLIPLFRAVFGSLSVLEVFCCFVSGVGLCGCLLGGILIYITWYSVCFYMAKYLSILIVNILRNTLVFKIFSVYL